MRTQDELKELFIERKKLDFYAFDMEDLICLLDLTEEEITEHREYLQKLINKDRYMARNQARNVILRGKGTQILLALYKTLVNDDELEKLKEEGQNTSLNDQEITLVIN